MLISAESVEEAAAAETRDDLIIVYIQTDAHKLVVRSRLPGDKYRPSGFPGRRKVKEMMSEAEIPLPLREVWPVVVGSSGIVWVPGARVSEEYRVKEGLSPVIKLSLLRGGCNGGKR
jgi:tRNA(Ile)-lysidine synthase